MGRNFHLKKRSVLFIWNANNNNNNAENQPLLILIDCACETRLSLFALFLGPLSPNQKHAFKILPTEHKIKNYMLCTKSFFMSIIWIFSMSFVAEIPSAHEKTESFRSKHHRHHTTTAICGGGRNMGATGVCFNGNNRHVRGGMRIRCCHL